MPRPKIMDVRQHINIYMEQDDYKQIEKMAKALGKPVSEVIRARLEQPKGWLERLVVEKICPKN